MSGAPAALAPANPLAGRRFLLVTMPSGPFSRALARSLRRRGARVQRVLLNGGDWLDWGSAEAVWAHAASPWRGWLAERLSSLAITDVMVFGDSQIYARQALETARAAGVTTWVLENGYLRPNWVTLERDGVNANSAMPRDAAAYDATPGPEILPDPMHIGAITPFHTVHIFNYFAGYTLGRPWFRAWRWPYAQGMWAQGGHHIRRYVKAVLARGWRERQAARLAAGGRRYFLLCLQREGDSQLVAHSDLKTNQALLERVVADFAANAPPDCLLAVKNHPLDPGVCDLAHLTTCLAIRAGCVQRVRFLEGGVFAALARASAGVISVNSTAALAALQFGRPVKLLGRALFDIEGLADQQPLASFWVSPQAPDAALFRRFRHTLQERTQVAGNFHNPRYLRPTAEAVARRITRG